MSPASWQIVIAFRLHHLYFEAQTIALGHPNVLAKQSSRTTRATAARDTLTMRKAFTRVSSGADQTTSVTSPSKRARCMPKCLSPLRFLAHFPSDGPSHPRTPPRLTREQSRDPSHNVRKKKSRARGVPPADPLLSDAGRAFLFPSPALSQSSSRRALPAQDPSNPAQHSRARRDSRARPAALCGPRSLGRETEQRGPLSRRSRRGGAGTLELIVGLLAPWRGAQASARRKAL